MSDITTAEPVVLSGEERHVIAAALELAAELQDALGHDPRTSAVKRDLAVRLRGYSIGGAIVMQELTDPAWVSNDLTRPQECAADAMAAKHGRSRVRHQADGSVVITGMTDDVDRETVCIETDGRERWRA